MLKNMLAGAALHKCEGMAKLPLQHSHLPHSHVPWYAAFLQISATVPD